MICGLKSFPLAVVLEDNEKLVETEFGIKGFTVMVKLWQAISAHGYYMKWDIDTQLLFISDYHLDTVGRGCVSEIVTCCVRRGVFDTELYEKYQILTSKRSQETFLNATKRKEKVVMDKRYCLPIVYTFIETASKKGKNVNIFFKNADNSEQTKLNKTKLNILPPNSACEDVEIEGMKEFCERFNINVDGYDGTFCEINFVLLTEYYEKSKTFLQVKPFAKNLKWICKNYKTIITGQYDDFEKKQNPTATKQEVRGESKLDIAQRAYERLVMEEQGNDDQSRNSQNDDGNRNELRKRS